MSLTIFVNLMALKDSLWQYTYLSRTGLQSIRTKYHEYGLMLTDREANTQGLLDRSSSMDSKFVK